MRKQLVKLTLRDLLPNSGLIHSNYILHFRLWNGSYSFLNLNKNEHVFVNGYAGINLNPQTRRVNFIIHHKEITQHE